MRRSARARTASDPGVLTRWQSSRASTLKTIVSQALAVCAPANSSRGRTAQPRKGGFETELTVSAWVRPAKDAQGKVRHRTDARDPGAQSTGPVAWPKIAWEDRGNDIRREPIRVTRKCSISNGHHECGRISLTLSCPWLPMAAQSCPQLPDFWLRRPASKRNVPQVISTEELR